MYFSRERQEAGYLKILQVSTDDQLADPLTKQLPNPRFPLLRDLTGIAMSQNSCLELFFHPSCYQFLFERVLKLKHKLTPPDESILNYLTL
jgi:hypothetical protein